MDRNNIIILRKGNHYEAWGSLTQICKVHELPYHTLKTNSFPFEFKGFHFNRVPFRTKLIDNAI